MVTDTGQGSGTWRDAEMLCVAPGQGTRGAHGLCNGSLQNQP